MLPHPSKGRGGLTFVCVVPPAEARGGGQSWWARCPPGNEGGWRRGHRSCQAPTRRVLVPPFERKGGGYLVDL